MLSRVFTALALIVGTVVLSAQTPPDNQELQKRIAALEANQKEILKQLLEIKALITQPRPMVPPTSAALPPGRVAAPPPGLALPAKPISIDGAASRGNASAKLTLVEFSDFQCPFCGRYSRETFDKIVTEYVDTGKVRYVFRNLPIESLHPRAFKSAEAAECARRQGKFWEMHSRLFKNQQALTDLDLAAHAQALGLDTSAYGACVKGAATARIRQDLADGAALAITGTPAFFIGVAADNKVKVLRRLTGAKNYAEFKATFDALLSTPNLQ